jgi:hypothetical protein
MLILYISLIMKIKFDGDRNRIRSRPGLLGQLQHTPRVPIQSTTDNESICHY